MRIIEKNHEGFSTVLSLGLIPLSGFATDIYLPSLPSMASSLHVSGAAVQLSLVIFLVTSGISQFFVGSLLDSFGRYRLNIAALVVFALASFTIALTNSIYVIYLMRVIHGITVAMIVVGKRAYFVDIYSGDKLKRYTSLFSIIWATAPIVAPFLGGYLQKFFGWESNFYFLGILTSLIVILELIFGGESLRIFQKFELKSISAVYLSMLKTTDFSLGLIVLALCYSMLIIYGLTSPFIIEHVFHYSPVVTGYCALLSGAALMTGGLISRTLIALSFMKKIVSAIILQLIIAASMMAVSGSLTSLQLMMPFVLGLHLLSGFIFNNFFSYCLGRFSQNAGIASGITGGSMFIGTSFFSYSITNILNIKSPSMLAIAYIVLVLLISVTFFLFFRKKYAYEKGNLLKMA